MKKILTLLIAVIAVASVHAQSREQTRDVILGNPNGGYGSNRGQYPSYPTYPNNRNYGYDRQYQIDQVNREIDSRIHAVNNDRYMSRKDRKREIKALENERRYRIDEINRNYNNGYGSYDSRYDRHDNGNHKGWYKGKGNPHRDDDDRYDDDRRH